MRLYTTNVKGGVFLLIIHETLAAQSTAMNLFDSAMEQSDGNREHALEMYVENYFDCVPDFCRNNAIHVVDSLGDIHACFLTNKYSLFFTYGVHCSVFQTTLWGMLNTVGSIDREHLCFFRPGNADDVWQAIAAIESIIRDDMLSRAVRMGRSSITRLGSADLCFLLANIFQCIDQAEWALQEIKPYLRSSLIRVRFGSSHDLMEYCSTQDLTTIQDINKCSIIQKCEDDALVLQACEYGDVTEV